MIYNSSIEQNRAKAMAVHCWRYHVLWYKSLMALHVSATMMGQVAIRGALLEVSRPQVQTTDRIAWISGGDGTGGHQQE